MGSDREGNKIERKRELVGSENIRKWDKNKLQKKKKNLKKWKEIKPEGKKIKRKKKDK